MATLLENKKARMNYDVLNEFEAGVELSGSEVKSLRSRHGSLEGSYVIVRGEEAYLVNAHIPPYQQANIPESYDPYHPRKLLLQKKEIAELGGQEKHKGLTVVPLSLYTKGRYIKVKVAIARGRKKHDKREVLKKRDAERETRRILKNQ